jgi:hypothetical protein
MFYITFNDISVTMGTLSVLQFTASYYPLSIYNFSKFIIAFYNVMQKKKLNTIFLYPLNQRLIIEIFLM